MDAQVVQTCKEDISNRQFWFHSNLKNQK